MKSPKKWTKAQIKRLQHRVALVGAVTLLASGMFVLIIGLSQTIAGERATLGKKTATIVTYDVPKPNITKCFLTKNKNSRSGIAIDTVKGVVIHYTANPGTDAMANRNYFESRKDMPDTQSNKVSSHFIIGLDGTIIQCLPLSEISYASNDRNHDTISIECCHPDDTGAFTKQTRESLVKLTAWLCGKFCIEENDVIRHYDVTGKNCPKYYVEHTKKWETLKDDIYRFMKPYAKYQSQ